MLRLVEAKKPEELKLDGIEVIATRKSQYGWMTSVTLRDKAGRVAEFIGDSSQIKILVPAPLEMVKRWYLTGRYLDALDINEVFADRAAAQARLDELTRKAVDGECKLAIEERTEPDQVPTAAPACDTPF